MKRIYLACLFLDLWLTSTFAPCVALAQTETVLYDFCSQTNCTDGEYPIARLTAEGGNFYGTTPSGGLWGYGTVFELSPNGIGGWNETVLHSFTGKLDGKYPQSYVMFDSAGNLYTTAQGGGANGYGTVFEMSPMDGKWTETVLYSFCPDAGCIDGAHPVSGVSFDAAGNLYSVTSAGGAHGMGVAYELSPAGDGWKEQVIYSFFSHDGCSAGYAGLTIDTTGNIFGIGCETVFELSPSGSGGWNSTAIYNFPGYPRDGANPQGTPVLDQAGNLYGTTLSGGANNKGTVYKLTQGKNGWTETRLYSFKGSAKDGNHPFAGIVFDVAGNIYGTTSVGGGGKVGYGTVYELEAPVGKGQYKERVLWSFNGTDGDWPSYGSLILDSTGNLYGVTPYGGLSGTGSIFELTP